MKTIPYNKFKHGQRVICDIAGTKIDDARISIDRDGRLYVCQNIKKGGVAYNKLSYKYSWYLLSKNDDYYDGREEVANLKFFPRTLDTLEEGDVLLDPDGCKFMVLGICGKVYFLSEENDFSRAAYYPCTLEELKEDYTLKQEEVEQEEQIQELTLEEIADKMGIPVEKLRIKD